MIIILMAIPVPGNVNMLSIPIRITYIYPTNYLKLSVSQIFNERGRMPDEVYYSWLLVIHENHNPGNYAPVVHYSPFVV